MAPGEERKLFGHFRLRLEQSPESKTLLSARWISCWSELDLYTGTSEPIYRSGEVAHDDWSDGMIRGQLIAEDDYDGYPFTLKFCRTLTEAGIWLERIESQAR